jgi:hypothetical protein
MTQPSLEGLCQLVGGRARCFFSQLDLLLSGNILKAV